MEFVALVALGKRTEDVENCAVEPHTKHQVSRLSQREMVTYWNSMTCSWLFWSHAMSLPRESAQAKIFWYFASAKAMGTRSTIGVPSAME